MALQRASAIVGLNIAYFAIEYLTAKSHALTDWIRAVSRVCILSALLLLQCFEQRRHGQSLEQPFANIMQPITAARAIRPKAPVAAERMEDCGVREDSDSK